MAGSKYIPFFTIQLLHNYNNGNQCTAVQLTPDVATSTLMQSLNVVCKQVDNLVMFYILCDPLYTTCPLYYPKVTDVFRFSISVTDTTFFNYTNLCGWGRSNNDLYYLSNQANNTLVPGSSPPLNYLSSVISEYSDLVPGAFNKGEFCISSAGIYEAVQIGNTSTPPIPASGNSYSFDPESGAFYPEYGTTEAGYFWYNRGSGQSFVSSQDVYQVAGNSYYFPLATPNTFTSATTTIYAYNVKTNYPDILVTNPPIYQNYGTPNVPGCNVNLQGLPSGLYLVNVNGQTQNLFVDATGQLTSGLGVIEIYATPNYLTSSAGSGYQLFFENNLSVLTGGTLCNPTYTIQFANNLVYWQYIPATIPAGATPTLDTINFGNIAFLDFYATAFGSGSGIPTPDISRRGSSLLMIPLVETIPGNTSPYELVCPQATGPPTISLPLAQVVQLAQLYDSYAANSGSGASGYVSQLLVSQNYLNVF